MTFLHQLTPAVISLFCLVLSALVFAGEPGGIYGDWAIRKIDDRLIPASIDSHLSFSEDNRIGAKAGCNQLVAGFSLNNNKIDIKQAAATRKMCSEDAMEYEALLFKALESTASIRLKDETLTLMDEKDNAVLQAVRQ